MLNVCYSKSNNCIQNKMAHLVKKKKKKEYISNFFWVSDYLQFEIKRILLKVLKVVVTDTDWLKSEYANSYNFNIHIYYIFK